MSSTVSSPTIYYAVVDSTGVIAQYGQTQASMWPSLQQAVSAVQIALAQYTLLLAGGSYLWRLNQLVLLPPTAAPIAEAQAAATAIIDSQAESARLQFITAGFGQMMVYMVKAQEAQALLAAYPTEAAFNAASPPPSAGEYPLLFDEVGITASDAWGVATVIAGLNAQWLGIAATIERQRLGSKQAVMAATTQAQVAGIMNITWPTPASVQAAFAALQPITGSLDLTVSATLSAS